MPDTPPASGRTLALGDIHGCDVAFDVLLSKLELTADDTLVVLGDAVDRGPGTRQVIDRLIQLQQACRLIFIIGNHEEMMLDAIDGGGWLSGWIDFGGHETLESYGGELDQIPEEHIEFLKSGRSYFKTDTEIFIHATLDPAVPLAEQRPECLRWNKLTGMEPPHPSGKRVICGHTPVTTGLPAVFPGWVCLDTWVYNGLFLTALDVATDAIYQAQQSGTYRGGITLADLG